MSKIKKRAIEAGLHDGVIAETREDECYSILSFLDTIEVKDVDLDTEQRQYLTKHFNVYDDGVLQSKKSGLPLRTYDIIKVAKHFFELGMQVSNKV